MTCTARQRWQARFCTNDRRRRTFVLDATLNDFAGVECIGKFREAAQRGEPAPDVGLDPAADLLA